ncbi:MAG: nucleotidyltransferase [Oscillospiraceae bacterium]|nr:nucleotidyltransferase [Oscillospiraceae bacterium]
MNEPSLVILAAGMGSRFGGLKQITPIGDNGELIIDFSIYDALRAGFKKVVFIIKEENEADFERLIGSKVRPFAEVQYCYQSMTDIPPDQSAPEGRTKPWGTGHAALCCRSVVDGPFAVINSDDYYGPQAFQLLYDYLSTAKDDELAHYAMVGYRLGNTLTENGSVSRGVCEENEEHFLTCITERTKIEGRGSVAVFKEEDGEQELSLDTVVSMNMWAFTASALEALQQEFELFFAQKVLMDPMKAEFYLPSAVDAMIKAGKADVKVLRSPDKWYGVTYKEDKESVGAAMKNLKVNGTYPQELWKR